MNNWLINVLTLTKLSSNWVTLKYLGNTVRLKLINTTQH